MQMGLARSLPSKTFETVMIRGNWFSLLQEVRMFCPQILSQISGLQI